MTIATASPRERLESGDHGMPEAARPRVLDAAQLRDLPVQARQHVAGAIGAVVVDDDDLERDGRGAQPRRERAHASA